jgi:hypothetical protein
MESVFALPESMALILGEKGAASHRNRLNNTIPDSYRKPNIIKDFILKS